ncbi:DUF2971 domain-containing protein [Saccharobesus litoralis]|uniref:DUF2971 domain-containing protein n=1 Tax=Saccharobesus litoralis TaxID=2172099 RepID=A0A2S0VXX7_9ALTE|nr:DUF2971 domain-containing protein [Saccharobesus litoralis]AWB69076.1 DUF2971 domain-containing protein [Saccharobesus litoralis]
MSLYKYLTTENALRVLDGTVRFTQPGAFNDPFEMVPELHVPEDFEPKDISISFDPIAPRRQPSVGELAVDFESDHCNDVNSRKILSELNQSFGILCLSKNESSLLMWSHYAGEYSGAVIEFDEKHEFFMGLIDIDYRENRPKKDISSYLSGEPPIPIAELCVKPKDWEYEKECRIVRNLSDCKEVGEYNGFPVYVLDVPSAAIKSITLGERMPVESQREIWHKIKNTNISLSLAAIANRGYEFRKEPIKSNQPISKKSPFISPRTAHIFTELQNELGEAARWNIKEHELSDIFNSPL